MAIIVDTGPIYALADADDQYHRATKKYIAATTELLIVPSPVVPEACYLLREHLGVEAELQFLRALANQELTLEHFTAKDLARAIRILEQYREAAFGIVDATVMAMAERLNIKTILTVDRRDFSLFRPKHCPAFQLVPESLTSPQR